MVSIYKENDKTFYFFRRDISGNIIKTRPKELWFTVRDKNDDVVFTKTLSNGGIVQGEDFSWLINIFPHDTSNVSHGNYFCDVKIRNESNKEYTIVKPQGFVIKRVATKSQI
jgi:hypothetical protein